MSAWIEGTVNSRDTGGLPLVDGGATRPGVLYRSDALAGATDRGVATLVAGVGTVIDLRTALECEGAPSPAALGGAVRTVRMPLLEGALAGLPDRPGGAGAPGPSAAPAAPTADGVGVPSLAELYVGMLAGSAETFAAIAREVARADDPDGPVGGTLVHCSAGKDRTGVAVALLLDAVGVSRAAIVADYAATEAHLAGPWAKRALERLEAWGIPLVPALVDLVTASPPRAIETALEWVDARGGAAAYLAGGGLTERELAALRMRMAGRRAPEPVR